MELLILLASLDTSNIKEIFLVSNLTEEAELKNILTV